ncbi:hypothetical protein [Nonlabens marinus]|uniref:Uncharacterized protein n=1 Tax=Nonlabens marinus S1-08 TaxID=1454201 RepID=W8VXC6_9FLAO|nr:hypothetical protein [Nonlabens marinus]BAO55692.1 hypothetical protein NMS_1683 [Nonlabens marinus S1-08]
MKYLVLILSLTFTTFCIAQGENEQIKIDFQKYASALKSKQYTQATSYMPDALFEKVGKEQLVQEMKNTFESDETDVKIKAIEIVGYSDKSTLDGITYVPIQFNQKFDIKYLNLFDATDDEQSRNSTTKFIVQMLNESMPESNVSFDQKQEVFVVSSNKKAVAMKSSAADSWKFIVIEAQLRSKLEGLLPAIVIQKLKI